MLYLQINLFKNICWSRNLSFISILRYSFSPIDDSEVSVDITFFIIFIRFDSYLSLNVIYHLTCSIMFFLISYLKNLEVPFCRGDNDCYMIGGKCNHSNGICYLPIYTVEPIIVDTTTGT